MKFPWFNKNKQPHIKSDFKALYQKAQEDRTLALKQNILGGVAVFFFLIAAFSFFNYLELPVINTINLLILVLALIFGLIFIYFMSFVSETRWLVFWIFIIMLVSLLPFLSYFKSLSFFTILSILISFCFIWYGTYAIKNTAQNYLKFNWSHFVKAGSKFIILGVLCLSLLSLYQKYLQEASNKPTILDYSFYVLENIFKGFSFISSGNATLDEIMTKSIAQNPLMQNYENLISMSQTEDVQKLLKENLSQSLGIKIQGNEKITDLLKQYLENSENPLIRVIVIICGFFVIFGIFSTLVTILDLFTGLVGWLVLKIFLSTKIFKIQTRSVPQETLSL